MPAIVPSWCRSASAITVKPSAAMTIQRRRSERTGVLFISLSGECTHGDEESDLCSNRGHCEERPIVAGGIAWKKGGNKGDRARRGGDARDRCAEAEKRQHRDDGD